MEGRDRLNLGAIWKNARIGCPDSDSLRAYLERLLEPAQQEYLRYHIEVIRCPQCRRQLRELACGDEDHAASSCGCL